MQGHIPLELVGTTSVAVILIERAVARAKLGIVVTLLPPNDEVVAPQVGRTAQITTGYASRQLPSIQNSTTSRAPGTTATSSPLNELSMSWKSPVRCAQGVSSTL